MLQVLFTENSEVKNVLCGTASLLKASLLFSKDVIRLWLEPVTDDVQFSL